MRHSAKGIVVVRKHKYFRFPSINLTFLFLILT